MQEYENFRNFVFLSGFKNYVVKKSDEF